MGISFTCSNADTSAMRVNGSLKIPFTADSCLDLLVSANQTSALPSSSLSYTCESGSGEVCVDPIPESGALSVTISDDDESSVCSFTVPV